MLQCDVRRTASVKGAVRLGMGVGILYRNAVTSAVTSGNFRFVNVPELKQMGIQSFIIYDKRKPLAPISQEFLQVIHDEKNMQSRNNKEFQFPTFGAHPYFENSCSRSRIPSPS